MGQSQALSCAQEYPTLSRRDVEAVFQGISPGRPRSPSRQSAYSYTGSPVEGYVVSRDRPYEGSYASRRPSVQHGDGEDHGGLSPEAPAPVMPRIRVRYGHAGGREAGSVPVDAAVMAAVQQAAASQYGGGAAAPGSGAAPAPRTLRPCPSTGQIPRQARSSSATDGQPVNSAGPLPVREAAAGGAASQVQRGVPQVPRLRPTPSVPPQPGGPSTTQPQQGPEPRLQAAPAASGAAPRPQPVLADPPQPQMRMQPRRQRESQAPQREAQRQQEEGHQQLAPSDHLTQRRRPHQQERILQDQEQERQFQDQEQQLQNLQQQLQSLQLQRRQRQHQHQEQQAQQQVQQQGQQGQQQGQGHGQGQGQGQGHGPGHGQGQQQNPLEIIVVIPDPSERQQEGQERQEPPAGGTGQHHGSAHGNGHGHGHGHGHHHRMRPLEAAFTEAIRSVEADSPSASSGGGTPKAARNLRNLVPPRREEMSPLPSPGLGSSIFGRTPARAGASTTCSTPSSRASQIDAVRRYLQPPPALDSTVRSMFEHYYVWYALYLVAIMLVGTTAILLLDRDMPFIDALFLGVSCGTTTGMSTIDFTSRLWTTHVICWLLTILNSNILLSVVPVLMRYRSMRDHSTKMRKEGGAFFGLLTTVDDERIALQVIVRLVIGYWLVMQVVGFLVLWIILSNSREGPGDAWSALFLATSAFHNLGLTTMPEGLPLGGSSRAWWLLIVLMILMLAGNTYYPVILRGMVWLYRDFTADDDRRRVLTMLLQFPRSCYTHLFPSYATKWLAVVTPLLVLVQIVALGISEVWAPDQGLWADLSFAEKLLGVVFQSVATRCTGFSVLNLELISSTSAFVLTVCMWISSSPVVVVMRSTTRINGRTVLEYSMDNEAKQRRTNANIVMGQLNTFLSQNSFLLLSLFWLTLISEELHTDGRKERQDRFLSILFEFAAAYTTVGYSMSSSPWSRCKEFSEVGRLCLMVAMFAGRMRGLPESMDPTIRFSSAGTQARAASPAGSVVDGPTSQILRTFRQARPARWTEVVQIGQESESDLDGLELKSEHSMEPYQEPPTVAPRR